MNLASTILRTLPKRYPNTISKTIACQESTTNKAPSSSSSSSSGSDSDEDVKAKKLNSNEAVARLNTLLQEMVTTSSSSQIKLAHPKNKKGQGLKDKESISTEPEVKQVVNAVKSVAESIGGDTKQIESELLKKLLNPVENTSSASLSDILKGMKIERDVKPTQQSRAEQVRTALKKISDAPRATPRGANQRHIKQPRSPINDQRINRGKDSQQVGNTEHKAMYF